MRSLSSRLLAFLVFLMSVQPMLAHDVTVSGTQNFSALDGSSSDHDGVSNGVFTVSDGNLVVNGTVNCNDGLFGGPCPMVFTVSGNLTMNAGSALYSEDRLGTGSPAGITLNVGGNLVLNGGSGLTPAPIISAAALLTSVANGGFVTANISGSTTIASAATIDVGSFSGQAGTISLTSGGAISIDGNLLSGPSRTLLPFSITGAMLFGAGGNQAGGNIVVSSTTFLEPALILGSNASVISQGENNGAGDITIEGCGVEVRGTVATLSKKDDPARISIRSGKDLLVDGRDLNGSGSRRGRLRSDITLNGTAVDRGVDVFAGESITIQGPTGSGSAYVITSKPGLAGSKNDGGKVRVTSLADAVTISGRAIDVGANNPGDGGGSITVHAKGDANLDTAVFRAFGDYQTGNNSRNGGAVVVRSFSEDVLWTNGLGDVRPIGSSSGLPLSAQGTIALTACGTVNTAGTSFPANGSPTSVFPVVTTGSCSPAAPSLPAGVPPLVTCNTPPVANDTSATTNEDTTVTITLSGSDVDGDSLTFTIVSGPANGSLGPIVPTGPTTATVNYTPNFNYNGSDSFVFRANDGNGGTDDATATITIVAVNDPPTFLAGPTVNAFEDAGAQTIANWVTSISPGPADESAQTVTFIVTNDNNALFSVQPAVASNGTLTFTPATNQFGSATITIVAQDNGGTANGGDDTSNAQTSTINVNGVNDEPSFTAGSSQTVNEDAGTQTVSPWATGISAGPNEGSQTLTFVVANNNNALFSAQPAVAADGTLTYTPAANANGSATVTVFLQDNGGTANGGDDTSNTQSFTITVNAVNDEPSFTSGGNVTVLEDSGTYSASWATGISAGPADESGQTVTFTTSNDNNALFSVQPSVASNGMLTFTLSANAFGSATVTIFAQDNGGTANGGDDTSPSQTFVIDVTPVNDEPSFTGGGDVTVNEDSSAYSAAWATAITAGSNEGGQTVAFNVSNNNNALFSAQPSISPSGVLSFTLAADANGTATVTVFLTDDGGTANGGDDTSLSQSFTITVNAVNDAPTFTSGGDVIVSEDSGAYSASWATGISAGPADESGQLLTFAVSNDNGALFSMQPAISASGVLTFTLAANTFGSATVTVTLSDNGGTANGGVNTSASQTFTISVNTINDEPSFTSGGDVTVNEDSGAYSAAWASAISAGPNESGQTLTFVASNDNNALFAAQPSISSSGVLTFTPAANANGVATVSVYLMDDGGTANGGDDTSPTQTFVITVNAVNDEPSFTPGGNVSVLEDSGTYSAAWATGISAGPNEGGQTVAFNVSNNNNGLFSAQPSISPAGALTFTVAANAFGSATVSVFLTDDGGTLNGGDDTSPTVTFTITVDPVNDAPSFTPGGSVAVNEDSGAYSATWATGISAGPANEAGQTVTFNVSNNNNVLFSVQPSIASNGTLTFTPAPNVFGSATVTVSLSDNGGTANGGIDTSAPVTFTITVNAVNDAPTAGADSWNTFGNTELRVDLATGTTPNVAATTGSGTGVLHNDADPEGDPFSITSVVACGDATAPFDCAFGGGSVLSLNSNGTFTFTPGPGETSASFQYVVTDAPSAGSPASTTGTVTLTLSEMIWYVNGSGLAGNGTSRTPFNNFSSLNGPGGVGDVDAANAYIFVHSSAVTGSIGLELNQRLLGAGVGLTVSSYPLVPVGPNPTVTSAADTVTLGGGVTGVEIAGLTLSSTGGNAIDVTNTSSTAPSSASIHDNVISGAGAEGIDVNAGSTAGTTAVTINNTPITSTGNGLDVSATGPAVISYTNGTVLSTAGSGINMAGSGNLTVSGLSNVTINGNTAGNGISIATATFDAIPGGTFDAMSAGAIAVGASGNPVGNAGVAMTNVRGNLAISSLNVFGGTTGVTMTGTGLFTGSAGMQVTSGAGAISAPSGVGLSITNATIGAADVNLTSINATGGVNGIALNNTGAVGGLIVSGTGAANSGGALSNATGDGILLSSTGGLSLTDMTVTNSAQSHIDATNVDGLALTRVSTDSSVDHGILGSTVRNLVINGGVFDRGGAGSVVANKHGVVITNLLGTSSVTGAAFRRSNTVQFRVQNTAATTPFPGAPDTLTVSNTTWDTHTGPFAGDHLSVDSGTGGNLRLTVNGTGGNNSFTTGGVAVQATGSGNGRIEANVSGALVNNTTAAVVVGTAGTSSGTYSIVGNKPANGTGFSNAGALAISVVNTSTGSLSGTIDDNAITNAPSGNGMQVILQGNGSGSATITNNVVSGNIANSGIRAQASNGNGFLSLNVHNNNVSLTNPFSLDAISIEAGGSGVGHTNTICLNMSNNSSSSAVSGEQGYRLRQRSGTTFNLQNFVGSGASATDVSNWVNVTKTNVGTTDIVIATAFSAAPGSCP